MPSQNGRLSQDAEGDVGGPSSVVHLKEPTELQPNNNNNHKDQIHHQHSPRSEASNGLLSSLMNAAHNAATMISSKHNGSQENLTPITSKGQHHRLPRLSSLFSQHSGTSEDELEESDINSQSEEVASVSLSASNVHFEPVHNSPINTLGQGNLSLSNFAQNEEPAADSTHVSMKGDPFSEGPTTKLLVSGAQEQKIVRRKSISQGSIASKASEVTYDPDDNDTHTLDTNEFSTVEMGDVLDAPTRRNINPKRDKEFHNIFKKLPNSEHLLAEYSCALSRDILVQGKMYLTQHYICFNSNILGWITHIVVPIQEIIQIEKKSTAGLFPNGMVIRTLHQKYVFATFLSRDSTFLVITKVWHNALQESKSDKPVLSRRSSSKPKADKTKLSQKNANSYPSAEASEDSGEQSDYSSIKNEKDNSVSLANGEMKSKLKLYRKDQASDSSLELSSDSEMEVDSISSPSDSSTSPEREAKRKQDSKSLINPGPSAHNPTTPGGAKESNEVEVFRDNFEAPLGVFYNLLFGPDNSFFIKTLEQAKNFDISKEKMTELSPEKKERSYSYTKPLGGPIGPKQTRCNITETLTFMDFNKYCEVLQVTKTPDVPSGNSFEVRTRLVMSWGKNNSTDLLVFTSVDWSAKSWIKSAIEKGSIDGQKSSMKVLSETISEIIKGGSSGVASAKRKRRSKSTSQPNPKPAETPINVTRTPSLLEQVVEMFEKIGHSVPASVPYFSDVTIGGIIVFFVSVIYSYLVASIFGLGHGSRSNTPQLHYAENDPFSILLYSNAQSRKTSEALLWDWILSRTDDIHPSSSSKNTQDQRFVDKNLEEMIRMTKQRLDAAYNDLL